ncbi:hypothetical protein AB0I98_27865 [Streptomyces sp. NPDC050211]|uniref:hypothetical protein n=1 Tax=Streptomyces sp. NPDC050211 TaxID=3154932 RepID=UPI003441C02E
MPYRVDLASQVEEALVELPERGRSEVMELIATALVRRESWPAPGGWDAATLFGPRSWITFAAYLDGIDLLDVGWTG